MLSYNIVSGQKPAEVDECFVQPCPIRILPPSDAVHTWQFAGHSPCSASCGGGKKQ